MTEQFLQECEQYIKNGGILSGTAFMSVDIPSHELIEVDPLAVKDYMAANRDLLFSQQLFRLIDSSGKTDSEVYKRAQMDRRLFSRIRSVKSYIPSKKTVISLCLALELPREDADMLLSSAGYSLSRASEFDLLISFCIEKQIYDLMSINELLYRFGFEIF